MSGKTTTVSNGDNRVTMADVARAAGCSQSTVSVVLSGDMDFRISARTRRRVIEAAADLGYRHTPKFRRVPATPPRASDPVPTKRPGGEASWTSRSRTARVSREIGLRIVGGLYPEHGLLPGDVELMAEFKVSRTVVREALKTLSAKGLLESKSRIGTRVRSRSGWQLFDPDVLLWHAEIGFDDNFLKALNEIRMVVEPEAAAFAAQRCKPEEVPLLYHWTDRMAAAGRSRRDFVDADLNFHLEVARIAANPFLPALSTLIEVALVAALTKSSPVDEPNGTAVSAREHCEVAEAIAKGDVEAARRAMRHVIGEGVRRASGG